LRRKKFRCAAFEWKRKLFGKEGKTQQEKQKSILKCTNIMQLTSHHNSRQSILTEKGNFQMFSFAEDENVVKFSRLNWSYLNHREKNHDLQLKLIQIVG
jgi:hypothetical protein